MESITFNQYEVTDGIATGYKVYNGSEQVGTLEFRSNEWIAATIDGCSIITLRTKCQADAVGWLQLTVKKTHKKRE